MVHLCQEAVLLRERAEVRHHSDRQGDLPERNRSVGEIHQREGDDRSRGRELLSYFWAKVNMPYLETPSELAEVLADKLGVYGGHDEKCEEKPGHLCRVCWVPLMADRIRESVKNELQLSGQERKAAK
jgi:hypothetical protein